MECKMEEQSINAPAEPHDLRYLVQRYEERQRSGEKYALVHFNIKNFRYYNTKHGSKAGDEILRLVLQCMEGELQEGEYAAHLYADNFAAILRYETADKIIYERMMQFINILYRIEDERIYRNLAVSMGIYEMSDPTVSFGDALNYANLCRRECTTLLHRSFCMELYDDSFYRSYMERMELEAETANAYKNYDFVTYLQPKIELKTGRIVGAESLLRWFDKDGVPIPLTKFLPILNQNSYINIIDVDMFDRCCQRLEQRLKSGLPVVPISFNISKTAFYDPNLLRDYTSVFEKYDIPKRLVEIEFMESISLNDSDHMKTVIEGFKRYGFTCTLDDFGNGYSSFNVLLNAPLDVVKLDRQFFVQNLNGESELIISAVVDLLHSLNMRVVAEGVELQEHIDYLQKCNCDYVQGYYYYRPMPESEFEALLEAQSTAAE